MEEVGDDDLSHHRQHSDENDGLGLDYAPLPGDDNLERVVELQGDQERQDLAEDGLEDLRGERIERPEEEEVDHARDQTIERDQDDDADDDGEKRGDKALEPLVGGEPGPVAPQVAPALRSPASHGGYDSEAELEVADAGSRDAPRRLGDSFS